MLQVNRGWENHRDIPDKKINHRDFARLKGRKGVVFETFEVPDVKES